ncbi:MAG: hypothetical protein ACAH83_09330 [Alphaproteobacteria bacterium]
MNFNIFRIVVPVVALFMAMPAQADFGYPKVSHTSAYIGSGRSDYYRTYPREDPEPFRCTYAADSTCPGRYDTGFSGDPRDDPEPFRCTYAADASCPGGNMSGIQ